MNTLNKSINQKNLKNKYVQDHVTLVGLTASSCYIQQADIENAVLQNLSVQTGNITGLTSTGVLTTNLTSTGVLTTNLTSTGVLTTNLTSTGVLTTNLTSTNCSISNLVVSANQTVSNITVNAGVLNNVVIGNLASNVAAFTYLSVLSVMDLSSERITASNLQSVGYYTQVMVTYLSITGTSTGTLLQGNTSGQIKYVIVTSAGAGASHTLSVPLLVLPAGGTSLVFTKAGQTVVLMYTGSIWVLLSQVS